jgi:outer membrane protein TolC
LRRENTRQEIAALLAMTSDAVAVLLDAPDETCQAVTPPPAAGIPADLLRQRPDVRAAESRFRGALYRVGVAEADLKPRLVLSGFIGSLVGSFSGADFSRSVAWLAAATGTALLFDGGRRRSVVALRKSEAELSALEYQAAVLGAVKEVETSLASVSRDRENTQALGIAASEATHAADQLRRAWRAGEIPILDVLEADRARFSSEAALAESETVERLDAAALFAALGGAERTSSDAR